jgi:hypothetical protein
VRIIPTGEPPRTSVVDFREEAVTALEVHGIERVRSSWTGMVTVALALAVIGGPVKAQAPADPHTVVQALKSEGATATRVAQELRRTFSHDAAASTRALHRGGYAALATAAALKDEFRVSGVVAYYTMRDNGYASMDVLDAIKRNGIRVRLDCIEPRGTPVPCGPFGGDQEQPAMSQVTWTPQSQGYTDSILTISGSGIPQVDILIASVVLAPIQNTSTIVRVRLPSSPITGPLIMRRKSDGVMGELVPVFKVEVPPAPTVTAANLNWTLIQQRAIDGAVEDARQWLSGARIVESKCVVNAALAVGSPGVLSSATGFKGSLRSYLLQAGAPAAMATAWENAFQEAWMEWAKNVTIPSLPFYPAFLAYPAAQTAPMPNTPTPLISLVSTGVLAMEPAALAQRVRTKVGSSVTSGAGSQAVDGFSVAMAARFAKFLHTSQVMMVMGSGPVPAYNPPTVPAAPVVGGKCSGENSLSGVGTF